MSEKITCPQCETEVDVSESHCTKCGALMATVGSREDLDALDDLDRTRVNDDEGDEYDEDEEMRTVRVEGFTGMDLAEAGISFEDTALPAQPAQPDQHDDYAFQQFMVQEDRTVVGGSDPQPWSGPVSSPNQGFGPASGAYPQAGGPFMGSGEYPMAGGYAGSGEFQGAGSAFGGQPPGQPPGGFVLVEGADSPSLTVRQEGVVLGRGEEMATYSGPADISRGSATSSPLKNVMWMGIVLVVLVIGGFMIKEYVLVDPTPIPKKTVYVTLDLKTEPSGAQIKLNGKLIEQTTPAVIQARIDERAYLEISKKGYKPVDFKWTPRGNEERSFKLISLTPPKPRVDPKLLALAAKKAIAPPKRRFRRRTRRVRRRRKAPPGHAGLRIVTDPPGAKVRVQGRLQRGRTPLTVYLQKGLEAKITIQKYGHHDSYFVWKAQGASKKVIRMYRHSWYNP